MKIEISNQTKGKVPVIFINEKGKIVSDLSSLRKEYRTIQRFLVDFQNYAETDFSKTRIHTVYHPKLMEILLVNIGETKKPTHWLNLGSKLGKHTKQATRREYSLFLPKKMKEVDFESYVEGLYVGNYQFKEYKTEEKEKKKELHFTLADGKAWKNGLQKALIRAEATNLTRDCCNKPGNDFTPSDFKAQVERIAKEGSLSLEVIDEAQAEKLGMGCFCSVAKGSEEPAYLLITQYKSKKKNAKNLMFVGKGLTFDSGGISIKPSASMEEMKFDMCGGGAVLGAMQAIAKLKPDVNVTSIIVTSENLINGKAFKPGDIYKSYKGLTVEIINTDAEGRLILADALAYGIEKYKPDAVVDFATLTAACMIALGGHYAGLFCNNEDLLRQLQSSAERTGECLWQLPLEERYVKQIKSDYADIKNSGGGMGGAITAAEFLHQFVGETAWAHVDIAGTAFNSKGFEYYPDKGSTGFGTRLILDLIENWQSK